VVDTTNAVDLADAEVVEVVEVVEVLGTSPRGDPETSP